MRHTKPTVLLMLLLWASGTAGQDARRTVRSMVPTCYDDGKACPNDCDAHVVFDMSQNGTGNAFEPTSTQDAPKKCIIGQECMICFSEERTSCLLVAYRGDGPPVGAFDFTPAFYSENCSRLDLPGVLASKCKELQQAIDMLKGKINCFEAPGEEECKALMVAAAAKKAADDIRYEECLKLGEAAFNSKYSNRPELQRSINCAYERHGTGRNSKGFAWRRLLDGACRSGTYAGRDGLDCCSTDLYAAAGLGRECKSFFPPK